MKLRGKRSQSWQRRFVALRFSGEALLIFEATDADGAKHGGHGNGAATLDAFAARGAPVLTISYGCVRGVELQPESKKKGCVFDLTVEGAAALAATGGKSGPGKPAVYSLWAESREAARRWSKAIEVICARPCGGSSSGSGGGGGGLASPAERMRAASEVPELQQRGGGDGAADAADDEGDARSAERKRVPSSGRARGRLSYFKSGAVAAGGGAGGVLAQGGRSRALTAGKRGRATSRPKEPAAADADAGAASAAGVPVSAAAAMARRHSFNHPTRATPTRRTSLWGGGATSSWAQAESGTDFGGGNTSARPSVRSWALLSAPAAADAGGGGGGVGGVEPAAQRRLSDSIMALPPAVRRFSQLAAKGQIVSAVEGIAKRRHARHGRDAGATRVPGEAAALGAGVDDGAALLALQRRLAGAMVDANKLRSSVRHMRDPSATVTPAVPAATAAAATAAAAAGAPSSSLLAAARKGSVAFDIPVSNISQGRRRDSTTRRKAAARSSVVARLQGYHASLQAQGPAATAAAQAEQQEERRRTAEEKLARAQRRRDSLLRRRQSQAAARNARAAHLSLAARQKEERETLELQLLEAQARERAAHSETGSDSEDDEGEGAVALQAMDEGDEGAAEARRRMQGRKSLQWLSSWVKGEGASRVAELSVGDEKNFAQDFARDLLAACANMSDEEEEEEEERGGRDYYSESEYSDEDEEAADFDHYWGGGEPSGSSEDEGGADSGPSWRGVAGWTLNGDELNTYYHHERSGTTVMRYAMESVDEDGEPVTSYYYSNPESVRGAQSVCTSSYEAAVKAACVACLSACLLLPLCAPVLSSCMACVRAFGMTDASYLPHPSSSAPSHARGACHRASLRGSHRRRRSTRRLATG